MARGIKHYEDTPTAPPGFVWVCAADGRVVADLRRADSACVLHSVLCHEAKNADGSWQAAPDSVL
jgi:hypothetical protein